MWTILSSTTQATSERRRLFLTLVFITCLLILLAGQYSGSLTLHSILRLSSTAQQDQGDQGEHNDIYVRRVELAQEQCSGRPPGKIASNLVYSDRENRLITCAMPKIGCTYWKNIFRFLGPDRHKYGSPYDIPRAVTHLSKFRHNYLDKGDYLVNSSTSLRFLFVRDPYSRLWSAWVDKYWLPDFWHGNCRHAKSTFHDFLHSNTRDDVLANPSKLNCHWVPYTYICDVCVFQPQFIGKIETFSTDTRYVMDYVNLTWVLDLPPAYTTGKGKDGKSKHFEHSVHEMNLLTKYYVNKEKKHKKRCLPTVKLYERLWIAYQYNGHIPAYASFPSEQLKKLNNTMTAFLELAEDAYLNWTNRKTEQHEQKKRAMVEAYRKVSDDVMERLQILYKLDFETYGYEKRPKELYNYRTSNVSLTPIFGGISKDKP